MLNAVVWIMLIIGVPNDMVVSGPSGFSFSQKQCEQVAAKYVLPKFLTHRPLTVSCIKAWQVK